MPNTHSYIIVDRYGNPMQTDARLEVYWHKAIADRMAVKYGGEVQPIRIETVKPVKRADHAKSE